MAVAAPDKTALKILMDTYWSPTGWRNDRSTSESDFSTAANAGLMFEPRRATHDEIVEAAIEANRALSPSAVARGFAYSLSTRRLDLRSALGSYAATVALPRHRFVGWDGVTCAVCGSIDSRTSDLNVLNFERFKWGGVRHLDPEYAAFDLEQFAAWGADLPADPEPVKAMFDALSGVNAGRAQQAADALKTVVKSNDWERRTIVGILGIAGVLQPRDLPSLRSTYVTYEERNALYPPGKTDWNYPAYRWSHSDGVDADSVRFWFGDDPSSRQ